MNPSFLTSNNIFELITASIITNNVPNWSDVKRIDSTDTNVCKYVFTKDNAVAEAVLYKYGTYEERTVICCSTQSGCPVGCRFCGAGDYFVRSLTSDEIFEQVYYMLNDKNIIGPNIKKFQIMFMSMGEPMLNWKNLETAIKKLHAWYPNAALLISTSAPKVDYSGVIEISKVIDKVGLQFSVHESTDEKRNELIPFKSKLTLKEISEIGEKWAWETGRSPFFNYCAHDKNSTEDDANRLKDLFDPRIWQCTISVICERDEYIAAANARQRELAVNFEQKMKDRGFQTRTFDPAGQDDIGGGCGQLWFIQQWMKKNPEKARKSVGFGRPDVHTPKEKENE